MKKFKFIDQSDFPFDSNIFDEIQTDYKYFEKIVAALISGSISGTNYIVHGCEISGGSLTAGVLIKNGELVRFDGGTYHGAGLTYINVVESTTQVTNAGTTYDLYSEKVAATSTTTGTLYESFTKIGKLRRDNEFNNYNFSPFDDLAGKTVNFAKYLITPYELRVRVQFDVDVEDVTNPAADVEVKNWGVGVPSYGTENVNHVVGSYTLFHLDASNNPVQQHKGDCIAGTSGRLYLLKPFTLNSSVAGLDKATYDDLTTGDGASYFKYRVELEFRITRSTI